VVGVWRAGSRAQESGDERKKWTGFTNWTLMFLIWPRNISRYVPQRSDVAEENKSLCSSEI
jgi:hypothetical protein